MTVATHETFHSSVGNKEQELSRLRVMAGAFTESDIETIFQHALSLEVGGDCDRERARQLFQFVATNSTDAENARLARESIQRIDRLRAQLAGMEPDAAGKVIGRLPPNRIGKGLKGWFLFLSRRHGKVI